MKNNRSYLVFAAYLVVLVLALRHDIRLQHEWLLMMERSSFSGGLRMYGMPTAYMPPLYAYYLLANKALFGFTDWIKISVAIQSIIYFFAFRFLFKSFFINAFSKPRILFLFTATLLFPPIFLGNIAVSSFSLSVSVFCGFFALLYRIYHAERYSSRDIILLILISAAGLYVRYEFIYIAILSAIIFLMLRKIRVWTFVAVCVAVFVSYLPWMLRNQKEIGKFTYATSLNYNFAKGYNEKYDVFSSYNFPYAPQTQEMLGIETLYQRFRSEKDIDEFLSALNRSFINEHPEMVLKLTVQKLGINILQYFPDYHGISQHRIYLLYSGFFILFQAALLWAVIKMYGRRQRFLFVFTLSLYLFFLFFYSIAPMPRYLLLFFPLFTTLIMKTIEERKFY